MLEINGAIQERQMEDSPKDQLTHEEYISADKIEKIVIRRFNHYLGAAFMCASLLGFIFGILGYKVYDVNKKVLESKKEIDTVTTRYKEEIRKLTEDSILRAVQVRTYFDKKDNMAKFENKCEESIDEHEIYRWIKLNGYEGSEKTALYLKQTMDFYNICNMKQFQDIITNDKQAFIGDLYKKVMGRDADIYGKFVYGIRLTHGYTEEDAKTRLCIQEEAINKRNINSGVCK
jgi:hypothetical protein